MKYKVEASKTVTNKWGKIIKTVNLLPNEDWEEYGNQQDAEDYAQSISAMYKKADVNLLASKLDKTWCIVAYKAGKEIFRNKNFNIFTGLICMDAMWMPISVRDFTPKETSTHSMANIAQGNYGKVVSFGPNLSIPIMKGSELEDLAIGAWVVPSSLAVFTLQKYHRNRMNNYNPPIPCEDTSTIPRIAFSDEVDWENVSLL